MKSSSIKKYTLLFGLISLLDLIALQVGFPILHTLAKSLLMPVLAGLLYNSGLAGTKKIVLIGIFFSWLGDIFLLMDTPGSFYFIAGLASFLTTHLLYIFYFLSIKKQAPSLLKKQPIWFLLISSYCVGLVIILLPHLGELKIPVALYATVISSMLLCSLHIFYNTNPPTNKFFILGALLFVLSDSLLAINKFYQTFSMASVGIMLTYCLAQYFIVRGCVTSEGSTNLTH
jgi:uncharacterized membrane protein YhhN